MNPPDCNALVIGGGPAGLRTAELLSGGGFSTVLADRMPSVGRKFLVAGRGGLNLTHSEPEENFPARYGTESARWKSLLADFSPAQVRTWAEGLGIETFVGTSGRVFPNGKQAAPLLRRWVSRLREQGVRFALRHDWTGFQRGTDGLFHVEFSTADGPVVHRARAVILALGGASWPQTGSNGEWISILAEAGIARSPLTPANCGYEVDWPPAFLEAAEGVPLKNLVVRAGDATAAGELLITRYGLEGGALYQLGRALRGMDVPQIYVDLKPTFSVDLLAAKLAATTGPNLLARANRAWRLSAGAAALLHLRGPFHDHLQVAQVAKSLPVALRGPRPIEEAISTAGGVSWGELDADLMLKKSPGLFCAGEMIDWDAPTGGYLLQGCLSTGTRAARGVIDFLGNGSTEKNLSSGTRRL